MGGSCTPPARGGVGASPTPGNFGIDRAGVCLASIGVSPALLVPIAGAEATVCGG